MEIRLYQTNSNTIETSKALSPLATLNGTLRDDCSILEPIIRVKYSEAIAGCNYAYIPAFGRYYYVKVEYSQEELILIMKVDVLMSWRANLLGSVAKMTRSNIGNLYIPDNLITNTAAHKIQYRKLGAGFTKADTYVITMAG